MEKHERAVVTGSASGIRASDVGSNAPRPSTYKFFFFNQNRELSLGWSFPPGSGVFRTWPRWSLSKYFHPHSLTSSWGKKKSSRCSAREESTQTKQQIICTIGTLIPGTPRRACGLNRSVQAACPSSRWVWLTWTWRESWDACQSTQCPCRLARRLLLPSGSSTNPPAGKNLKVL